MRTVRSRLVALFAMPVLLVAASPASAALIQTYADVTAFAGSAADNQVALVGSIASDLVGSHINLPTDSGNSKAQADVRGFVFASVSSSGFDSNGSEVFHARSVWEDTIGGGSYRFHITPGGLGISPTSNIPPSPSARYSVEVLLDGQLRWQSGASVVSQNGAGILTKTGTDLGGQEDSQFCCYSYIFGDYIFDLNLSAGVLTYVVDVAESDGSWAYVGDPFKPSSVEVVQPTSNGAPEPSTAMLVGIALLGLAGSRKARDS